nr:ATP-dependent RNA helicase A-like [Procambarus clarkii]
MKLLICVSLLVAVASAAPQGYNLNRPVGPGFPIGGCKNGEILNIDGSCAIPKVTRQVYVYTAPEQPIIKGPPPIIPQPEVISNILFIRAPEQPLQPEPIVVGPPRVSNVVYVLSKKQPNLGQKVIEVPAPPPKSPEVYFVNYGEGENPTLPGGVDLQSALNSAAHAGGQVVGGGVGVGGGFGGGVGVGGGFGGGVGVGGGFGGGVGVGGGFGGGVGVGGGFGDDDFSAEDGLGGGFGGGFGGGVGGGFGVSGGVSKPSGLYGAP